MATYTFANTLSATTPVTITGDGSFCEANPGGGAPTDYQEFVTEAGTISAVADWAAKAPAGLKALGIDTSCGQAMGDYTPILTAGSLSAATFNPTSISSPIIYIPPTNTATSSNNYGSPTTFGPQGSFWNGFIPITSTAQQQMLVNTGTNPQITDQFP